MINQRIQWRRTAAQGFTLIEVVIAILILALAVPPTLTMLDSASAGRVDSVNTTKATYLSTTVLEAVLADVTSTQETLGFEALADSNVYLSTANTGLYDRLATSVDSYIDVGFTYSVVIGELVASNGNVSAIAEDNIFRVITVYVRYNSATGTKFSMPVSLMVSEM